MDVILLSNDLVPGAHLPVAAPGLRQWGLAQGLRAHGLTTELVVPRQVADRPWQNVPGPAPDGAVVIDSRQLPEFLRSRSPSVVVLTNSNQYELVRDVPNTRYVYDFFAPKVLELVCRQGEHLDVDALAALRTRKVEALAGADAVMVNGEKKGPYALAWMLQTDRDASHVPMVTVPMCVPVHAEARRPVDLPLRVGIAGYLQAWSQPGEWLDVVGRAVDDGHVELHLLLPPHWGGRQVEPSDALQRLAGRDHVVTHTPKTYEAFVDFLADLDLVLDLFDWSLEREFAMVTRTVVALAAARPVIHPPFTEVSGMIAEYDAGWLLDTRSPDLDTQLDRILADPDEVTRRARNARRLATERIDPAVAVGPLVELFRRW